MKTIKIVKMKIDYCPQLFCKDCIFEEYRNKYSKGICRKTPFNEKRLSK